MPENILYAIYDNQTGEFISVQSRLVETSDTGYFIVEHPDEVIGKYAPDGVLTDRPAIVPPGPTETAPFTYDMTALPEDTKIKVANETDDLVSTQDRADPITMEDAGRYTISLDPPFPYLPWTVTVELV